jgi:hypothetical protein
MYSSSESIALLPSFVPSEKSEAHNYFYSVKMTHLFITSN